MTDAVESIAFTAEKPWHNLGREVDPNLSPEQMAEAAGINWQVETRPLYTSGPQGVINVPSKALVRTSDEKVLGIVGPKYVPTQNVEAMEFFSKFTQSGHMTMETAGALQEGRFIWGLAKLNKNFAIGDDINESYLLIVNPHITGYAVVADFTSIRVVCWNTLTMALSTASRRAFKMPHLRAFTGDMHTKAEEALGIGTEKTQELAEKANYLASRQVSSEQLKEFLTKLFKPVALTTEAEEEQLVAEVSTAADPTAEGEAAAEPRENRQRTVKLATQAFESGPGSDLPSARGTWWGAVNAVTYVVDHQTGKNADTRLFQSWVGEKAKQKIRALNTALEMAA
jgi:phage/plasmid-like protein (TIGR03299 family)